MKLALSPLPKLSGVSYHRGWAPFHYLKERGHATVALTVTKELTPELVRSALLGADVVLCQGPGGRFEDAPREWHERRGALVVDCDDDQWAAVAHNVEEHGGDPAERERIAELEQRVENFTTWLRGADLVTTTTPYLAQVLVNRGARAVAVCPNAVTPSMQRDQPHPSARGSKVLAQVRPRRKTRIGWTGGPSHWWDLPPLLLALRDVLGTDVGLEAVSLGPADWAAAPEWKGFTRAREAWHPLLFEDERGRKHDQFPFQLYYQALEAMAPDLAVIPLRDSDFNRSKSAITLHSWAIQEVPCVVSRCGPYAEAERAGFPAKFVEHGDVDGWKSAIRDLAYEPLAARALGRRAKEWVLAHACFPTAVLAWEKAFEKALALRLGTDVVSDDRGTEAA